VGVENSANAERALLYAKEKHSLNPHIVTLDFSPSLISATSKVFGEEVLQIDGFHVMQELNNGIRRDLLDYRDRFFRKEIKDLLALRCWISKIQEEISAKNSCSKKILKQKPRLNSQKVEKQPYFTLTTNITKLIRITDIERFSNYLNKLIAEWYRENDPILINYANKISTLLPKRAITRKRIIGIKIALLRKLKNYYRIYRRVLEEKSHDFYNNHWILFIQPEKLTIEREKFLKKFLAEYPELLEYRQLTLQVGDIYRAEIKDIDGHRIDNLSMKSYYSSKLKTAIKTLKKFKNAILRFSEVFRKDKSLGKACRANMEFFNRVVKAPFEKGLNRTKPNNVKNKLQLQLNCEVRLFPEKTPIGC